MSGEVSAAERYTKRYVRVHGKRMTYVEVGEGDPIVFLHGNPTSSYLWRNVIPHLEAVGRCIAPDLIGMGDSEKLDDSGPERYRFVEHRHHLDALLAELRVDDRVTLVVHDWGSALGFDWAKRHPDAVRGIAYMEALVAPIPDWSHLPNALRPILQDLRSPKGEALVLEQNVFVEQLLPGAVVRTLSDAEREVYRRPYLEPGESRRPTLTWPRQIPIEGEPKDVTEIISAYAEWLKTSDIPKLLVRAEPGALVRRALLELCRAWPNQQEVTVPGIHFIQEDCPDEIGIAIANWLRSL